MKIFFLSLFRIFEFRMISAAAKGFLWALVLSIQVISYGSYTILVHLCEENGQIQFNSSSMNLLIEFVKLKISLFAYLFRRFIRSSKSKYSYSNDDIEFKDSVLFESASSSSMLKPSNFFKASIGFSMPAFLYFINNNLAVYIQLYMDSTSYQMLSNLKIFTTACLYYFFFGRKTLTNSKIASLVLLFVAGLIYSVANLKSLSSYYLDELDLQSLFSSFDLKDITSPKLSRNVKIKFSLILITKFYLSKSRRI